MENCSLIQISGLVFLLKICLSENCMQTAGTSFFPADTVFFAFQGQAFFLNDGRSVMSLNNALMWAKVNAFSLVGNGVRLEPF